jgi:hypothetical protein
MVQVFFERKTGQEPTPSGLLRAANTLANPRPFRPARSEAADAFAANVRPHHQGNPGQRSQQPPWSRQGPNGSWLTSLCPLGLLVDCESLLHLIGSETMTTRE